MKTPYDCELEARLLRYTTIDSQSDATSQSQPSTAIQLDMQRLLMGELEEIGAQDITLTDYGTVLATIPATADHTSPVMGLLAHVDTAPRLQRVGRQTHSASRLQWRRHQLC